MNNKKYNIVDFYKFDESFFKEKFFEVFKDQKWLKVFINDNHHGYKHGNQVRLSCLKLIKAFTPSENKKLIAEGNIIDKNFPLESAIAVIQLSSMFHDSGRYNENGEVLANEQKEHHLLSLERAVKFCELISQKNIEIYIKDAIISHDFQNEEITPHLNSPKTIIGKTVQASDQLGWFHPSSVQRTIEFNKALGLPFINKDINLQDRLNWKTGNHNADAITVLLNQLFGPIGEDRFGISIAKEKIKTYKKLLENNILKESKIRGVENEVAGLIEDFYKQKNKI